MTVMTRRTWMAAAVVPALSLALGLGLAEPAVADALRDHRAAAIAHLDTAIRLGEQAGEELRAPTARDRLGEILARLRQMLDHAKGAETNMKHMKQLMRFQDPMLDYCIQRTDRTLGLIRSGLDGTGQPWENYVPMATGNLGDAVAILRQVRELVQ